MFVSLSKCEIAKKKNEKKNEMNNCRPSNWNSRFSLGISHRIDLHIILYWIAHCDGMRYCLITNDLIIAENIIFSISFFVSFYLHLTHGELITSDLESTLIHINEWLITKVSDFISFFYVQTDFHFFSWLSIELSLIYFIDLFKSVAIECSKRFDFRCKTDFKMSNRGILHRDVDDSLTHQGEFADKTETRER